MSSNYDPRAQGKVFRKVIGIGLLALGILGAVSLAMKEFRLALFGQSATGTAKKVEKVKTSTNSKWEWRNGQKVPVSRSGESTFMTIAYTTKDGQEVEFETLATFNTEGKVGDTHPVVYLASNPKNAKISTMKQLWLPMLIGCTFTIVCLGLGVYFTFAKPMFSDLDS